MVITAYYQANSCHPIIWQTLAFIYTRGEAFAQNYITQKVPIVFNIGPWLFFLELACFRLSTLGRASNRVGFLINSLFEFGIPLPSHTGMSFLDGLEMLAFRDPICGLLC